MGSEKTTPTKSESESNAHRRERSTQSFAHARDFPLRRLQRTLGNDAVQRFVQTKLQIGSSSDPSELEADQLATRVLSLNSPPPSAHGCSGCSAGHKCQKCKQEEARLIQAKAHPGVTLGAHTNAHSLSESALQNVGPGRPLESSVRDFFEPRFGHDFADVRIHDDGSTASLARSLRAQAFTSGNDLFFGRDGYQPNTSEGSWLLAHELTHVIQQSGRPARIQRKVAVDVFRDSVTPADAAEMTDKELRDQITLLKDQLPTLTVDSQDYLGAKENLLVLEEEVRKRSGTQKAAATQAQASSSAAPKAQAVPRPPGLPLDQGFTLQPLTGLPQNIADAIPEGKITVISPQALGTGGAQQPGVVNPFSFAEGGFTGSGTALTISLNQGLRSTGFVAAGENSIGIVGMPSWDPVRFLTKGVGPALPESTSLLGHTAVYVRIGNKIQVVRGLTPESFTKLLSRFQAIKSGKAGTAATLQEDAWLFTKTSAKSVEWAVPQEVAEQLAADLPATGSAPGVQWTGKPNVFEAPAGTQCVGTNCVLFAVEEAEKTLGSRIAVVTQEGGQIPITDLGSGGAVVPKTAGQGQFIQVLKSVESGTGELAPVEGALGPAVVGGMSKGVQVLKWGGRVFIVVGVVAGVAEVATAPEGKKVRTAVGAGAGFVGGLALGATAGLFCGPGAPVCSVVLGLGLGIAGALTARAAAEELYDEATGEARHGRRFDYPSPGFCFSGDTPVLLADFSWRSISQLRVGDQVLAPLENGSDPRDLAACEVTNLMQHPPQTCLRIELATGIHLRVTPNHPLLATRGWTPAGELTSNDALFCYDEAAGSIPRRVLHITMGPSPVPVYDITVKDRHAFFAGGVVAHNKPP